MGVTPTNVCQGPATLYAGLFGATEPLGSAITSPPSSSVWTDCGGTADGQPVVLEVDQTYTDITVDQLVDPIGARLTKRAIMVSATLEETTLANLNLALNNLLTISVQSGYTVADPITTASSSQPQYTAIIIDGWAPTTGTSENSCRRRIVVRKCLTSSKVALSYEKTKPALYTCSFTGYYVSSGIAPYEITEQNS